MKSGAADDGINARAASGLEQPQLNNLDTFKPDPAGGIPEINVRPSSPTSEGNRDVGFNNQPASAGGLHPGTLSSGTYNEYPPTV